ncbi:unnamed protein product [Laminaria digitata]
MSQTDARLVELELKYMEQSDLVDKLNGVVLEASTEVQLLTLRVQRLERQIEELLGSMDAPANERPPHY